MSTATVYVRHSSLKDYDGVIKNLEMGEVFKMQNCLNDEFMLSHGYVSRVDKSNVDGISECIGCGKKFIGVGYRNEHAMKARHEAIEVDGPQLKQPGSGVDPYASGSDRPLEPDGAPPPPPVSEREPVAAGAGESTSRRAPGAKANEVFRLG